MNRYNELKEEVLQISQELSALFSNTEQVPGTGAHSFNGWKKSISDIRRQLSEERIRVAVAGPIKSGKSTFANSLFKGDYLKRGAGVVTSIVTRIRSGESLKATLHFKSWDEVNADMEQSLVLLNPKPGEEKFDIRLEDDRNAAAQALESLNSDLLITRDTRSMNTVLLSSYLEGYERVRDIVSSDTLTRRYEGGDFGIHRNFVGDDSLSVYLRDIELEISSGDIDRDIEIADCQGSDSPNPLHLAMIQDYLLQTHLILYVISSRTGLRQADIRFLSIIRKMGISDNVLFILNFDFNEHESPDDLHALIRKVRDDISLIKPDPEIYTLSALFNLFKSLRASLPPKDRMRLEQWENEADFAGFSDQETARFESDLNHKLTAERCGLLLKNHLGRMEVISSGIRHWIGVYTDILSKDAAGADEAARKIKRHQKKMNQISSMTESTLNGTVKKVKQSVKTDIDRFFDISSAPVPSAVLRFIKNYDISYDKYDACLTPSNFTNTLYAVFQEFKQAVDTFIGENANPEIIRFIREEEEKIRESLESVIDPYTAMVTDALAEYNSTVEHFEISPIQEKRHQITLPDTELVKRSANLSFPSMGTSMRYSAKIKTEAILRFGFYSFIRAVKKLLKKPLGNGREGELLALKNGVVRMKQETEKATVFHFKDYRENLKFQYAFRLTDALSAILHDILMSQFQAYITDLSELVSLITEKRIDKEDTTETLKQIEQASEEILRRINTLMGEVACCRL